MKILGGSPVIKGEFHDTMCHKISHQNKHYEREPIVLQLYWITNVTHVPWVAWISMIIDVIWRNVNKNKNSGLPS